MSSGVSNINISHTRAGPHALPIMKFVEIKLTQPTHALPVTLQQLHVRNRGQHSGVFSHWLSPLVVQSRTVISFCRMKMEICSLHI